MINSKSDFEKSYKKRAKIALDPKDLNATVYKLVY